jgi:fucose 4-O-acetylase-like acetyltransferase
MQYVGKRTMDIYMLHYFLLPRNMEVVGQFFSDNVNPSIEFFVTTVFALLVILLCLIVGNVIRLSPLLAHYLLGAKKL